MAIYHLSAQVISRKAGRSATAAAAYRAGECIVDERTGEVHDFTRKGAVDYTEILLPDNAPTWASDRAQLWNRVEAAERRGDAQVAREINIALPVELDQAQQLELVREWVREQFTDRGMVADVALHDLDSHNPHAHIMLTMRELNGDEFGNKERSWNDRALLSEWRESWSDHANAALDRAGIEARIDHRTLAEQGIDRTPTTHLGPTASAYEERTGQKSRRRVEHERQAAERLQPADSGFTQWLRDELAGIEYEIDQIQIQGHPQPKPDRAALFDTRQPSGLQIGSDLQQRAAELAAKYQTPSHIERLTEQKAWFVIYKRNVDRALIEGWTLDRRADGVHLYRDGIELHDQGDLIRVRVSPDQQEQAARVAVEAALAKGWRLGEIEPTGSEQWRAAVHRETQRRIVEQMRLQDQAKSAPTVKPPERPQERFSEPELPEPYLEAVRAAQIMRDGSRNMQDEFLEARFHRDASDQVYGLAQELARTDDPHQRAEIQRELLERIEQEQEHGQDYDHGPSL